ncbi:MAG: hypothetical protein GY934_18490 [Gammaproteobacteria bacterium]|nr:hypothetical protein [Gammaproteobacteria bacterium]
MTDLVQDITGWNLMSEEWERDNDRYDQSTRKSERAFNLGVFLFYGLVVGIPAIIFILNEFPSWF